MGYTKVAPPTALPKDEFPKTLSSDEVYSIAETWLASFNSAVTTADATAFAGLFADCGIWRDIIAFTNDYRSIQKANILSAAAARLEEVAASDAQLATPAPVLARPFDDVAFIELNFTFQTKIGPALGITKLIPHAGSYAAYIVLTSLDGIHGHPERIGAHRVRGTHNAKVSYDDARAATIDDPQPDVLIVGGGHNGLTAAARLELLGVKALVVDSYKRIGDNWRLRYRSLSLHDPVHANHLAYMPYPPNWPLFTPSGKLANWLEHYADVFELRVWTESRVDNTKTKYNAATDKWDVTVLRQGVAHQFTVSHVIMATGLGGGYAKMPKPFPGQEKFKNPIVHSSKHTTGSQWKGKNALVVGACTSAHDISLDFYNNGVESVTMLQRSPTFVMSVANGVRIVNGSLYSEQGPPTEVADRLAESTPKLVAKLFHQRLVPQITSLDADLLAGLKKAGFQTTLGEDNSGFLMLALRKAGGYYYDTGCCSKIIDGSIKVKNGEIDHFTETSVVFKDGSTLSPDIVVFATGYTGFPDTVKDVLGEEYKPLVKEIWGLDSEGELNGVARDCGIPRVYFMVGALSNARFTSKILALQVLAERLGLIKERFSIAKHIEAAA
ncbi:hypothetical protein BZA70DRAFT_271873 [Myxozyma melibiosi]|uniref:Flavin-containing monooxygenase n=1 Tax=Myxozyma melibiosi TaxID=54550 RepID=A0ABR1FES5_9ASCO